jgi:hypothetical protein
LELYALWYSAGGIVKLESKRVQATRFLAVERPFRRDKHVGLRHTSSWSIYEDLEDGGAIAHHVKHDGKVELPFVGLGERAKKGGQVSTERLGLPFFEFVCETKDACRP